VLNGDGHFYRISTRPVEVSVEVNRTRVLRLARRWLGGMPSSTGQRPDGACRWATGNCPLATTGVSNGGHDAPVVTAGRRPGAVLGTDLAFGDGFAWSIGGAFWDTVPARTRRADPRFGARWADHRFRARSRHVGVVAVAIRAGAAKRTRPCSSVYFAWTWRASASSRW
jgi:hypothetical protein